MGDEIQFLGDLQRLEVRPGDIFVLKVPEKLTAQMVERIRAMLISALGGKNKVIVLDHGWELGIVGPLGADTG